MDVKGRQSIPQKSLRRSKRLISSVPSAATPLSQALIDSSHPSASPGMFYGANNIVITGGQFITSQSLAPTQKDGQLYTPSTTTPSVTSFGSSSELYQHYMSKMRAGTALWIPEPNKNIPMPNQIRGVSIGDVGIITEQGSFSFLFNVCLPRDHPVNQSTIPEWFQPIQPEMESCDIREINEFVPGTYLATESITKLQAESETRQALSYKFEAQPGDGAILVMPEGAISQDLENISKFRAYAAANLEHWYRYVNGTRGREIENGDLRLVIGCDKATSWAIAVMRNSDRPQTIDLRSLSRDSRPFGARYTWDLSGHFHGRTGPLYLGTLAKENENFPQNINQCLFVRTMNLKLNDQAWKKIIEEQQSFERLNLQSITVQSHKRKRNTDQQKVEEYHHYDKWRLGSLAIDQHEESISIAPGDEPPPARSRVSQLSPRSSVTTGSHPEDDKALSKSSKSYPLVVSSSSYSPSSVLPSQESIVRHSRIGRLSSVKHKSNALHNLMLIMFPEAKMAITEDDGHYRDLFPDDLLPSDDQLLERVKELYEIVFDQDTGVVYLERKATPKDSGEDQVPKDKNSDSKKKKGQWW